MPHLTQSPVVGRNFMTTSYIQFDNPKSVTQNLKDGQLKSSFKKVLVSILTNIIPKANPDFDNKIEDVDKWLVEFETETGIPIREIGLDNEGRVLFKMHYKNNDGYWTDNNLLLNDFKEKFNATKLDKEFFEWKWNIFDKISDFEIEIYKYEILSTGADGGHIYLTTEIEYLQQTRTLVIYFANKSDEEKIKVNRTIKLVGRLLDEGIHQSLSLLDTKLID